MGRGSHELRAALSTIGSAIPYFRAAKVPLTALRH